MLFACAVILSAISLEYLGMSFLPNTIGKCKGPQIRQEWRSLSPGEKDNYIQAVQCLQDLPSDLVGKGSFYDDFVYVHMFVGSQCSLDYPASVSSRD